MRKSSRTRWVLLCAVGVGGMVTSAASAAPYASGVSISGTTVNFILNESADSLTYSINGGPAQTLDPTTRGLKSFSLTSPTDTFSISTSKSDTTGYTIPTGGTVATSTNGLSQPSNAGGFRLISSDTNVLNRFNSPRGVDVNTNPNQANFGTSYISNSAAGSLTTGTTRTLGDGMYAVRADQSDAFGYGNTAQTGGITAWTSTPSGSAPWRNTVGQDGNVYIADFSDGTGNVWRMAPNLTAGAQVLAGTGGPSTVPPGQNHGSTTAVYAEGSSAGNDLTIYTLDEDLTSNAFGPGTADKNNLWRYSIGNDTALPYNGTPTRVNQSQPLLSLASSDMTRGADGKFYLAQNRAAGNEAGVVVLDSSGNTLYDSLSDSRFLLANPTAADILRNIQGIDVSADQQWMALILNNSDVAVVPLVGGIPDLANRMVIDTGTDINSGRDIAFDAVNNIHYVSSGQALYRVLSPGGLQSSTLSWDGTNYSFSFSQAVPEPATLSLAALAGMGLLARRRRA